MRRLSRPPARSSTRASRSRTGPASARVRFRPPDAFRPRRRLSAAHHQEAAFALDHRSSCSGSCAATPMSRWLKEHKVSIWDEWADESGDLGPVYGKQWRHWEAADGREIDQIADLIDLIRRDPPRAARSSPPGIRASSGGWRCRPATACSRPRSRTGGSTCSSTSAAPTSSSASRSISRATRSSRTCSPSNAGSSPATFVWTGGDCHLYSNHLEQAPRAAVAPSHARCRSSPCRACPTSIDGYAFEDFEISGYDPTRTSRPRSRSSPPPFTRHSAADYNRSLS